MAITRTQIAKQLLAQGGRTGFQGGGKDLGAGASGMGSGGKDRDRDNRDRGREESMKEAQRKADLRNITNRIRDEKIEEKLEKFRQLNSRSRKFQNFASKFSPVAMFASNFGPLNTRDFFTDNFLSSKNAPMTKEQFANLTNEQQEELFDNYMDARMSNEIDAYGNEINRGGGGGGINQIIPVDTTFAQAPSIMDQEPKEDEGLRLAFRANGGRIGFRGGDAAKSDRASGRNAGRADERGGVERGGGNRDRRRVEQYTKPPTVSGGGGGDQKTPVVVNPLKNLSTHFANNQKLKDAVALGLITNDEYNVLGGYDVKQTMGMGPVDSFMGSLAYNTVQSLKGEQPFGEIFGDAKRTAMGASNISPELQTKYENIMQMADGGRAGLAEGGMPYEGGIMDLESARQMYGLGKLVKKVTRTVKKIAKSPIGKAAILYAGTAGLGSIGSGLTGFSRFAPSNFMSNVGRIGSFITGGKLNPLNAINEVALTGKKNIFQRALGAIPGGAVTAGIVGTSLAAGFLTPAQEEEAQQIADETGIDIAEIRANPNKYLATRFMAEGGSTEKEPVAKKTMPLLDMDGKEMDLRAEGGFVPIGRMEKADDVPARLSKNEFVFTADAVRNAGDGDVDKGAEVMYNMMKNLESGGDVSEESQGLEGAREMFQTSQRLGEVI